MSLDRMAKLVLRRQGIGVKERVIRFRGHTIVFRYNVDRYDIYLNGALFSVVPTQDINEAVRVYKTTLCPP